MNARLDKSIMVLQFFGADQRYLAKLEGGKAHRIGKEPAVHYLTIRQLVHYLVRHRYLPSVSDVGPTTERTLFRALVLYLADEPLEDLAALDVPGDGEKPLDAEGADA